MQEQTYELLCSALIFYIYYTKIIPPCVYPFVRPFVRMFVRMGYLRNPLTYDHKILHA